jgi:hypothetical protein
MSTLAEGVLERCLNLLAAAGQPVAGGDFQRGRSAIPVARSGRLKTLPSRNVRHYNALLRNDEPVNLSP